MHRSSFLGLLLALFISGAVVDAALIYDNGSPDLINGFEITHWRQASQFTLGTGAILGNVRFWDLEASSAFQSSILWEIRSNSASNIPGAVLFSGTSVNLTHVVTGRNANPYPEFVNSFDLSSVSLPAGTYWVVLHNGPLSNNTSKDIFWETAINTSTLPSLSDLAPFAGNWESNNYNGSLSQLAFQLNGVPGPSVTAFGFNNGVPRISFTTVAGQHYRVEYKNNLTDASWTPVASAQNVPGTGSVIQVSDPDPNVGNLPRRFYRVVLL